MGFTYHDLVSRLYTDTYSTHAQIYHPTHIPINSNSVTTITETLLLSSMNSWAHMWLETTWENEATRKMEMKTAKTTKNTRTKMIHRKVLPHALLACCDLSQMFINLDFQHLSTIRGMTCITSDITHVACVAWPIITITESIMKRIGYSGVETHEVSNLKRTGSYVLQIT